MFVLGNIWGNLDNVLSHVYGLYVFKFSAIIFGFNELIHVI